MQQLSVSDRVRQFFAAFLAGDRAALEGYMAEDITFTSPRDDHIDRAAFFERCLPGSQFFRSHTIEQIFVQGEDAFVRYSAVLRDGSQLQNTEFIRLENGKLKTVDVYFGAATTVPDPAQTERTHQRA
jgi:ketosteroid isomerase-like protein